jgi:hypothetical protein
MTTPDQQPVDPSAPRVLLFGHHGAGKSALIGALLQAGEVQGERLRGEVVHSSVDLPRLREAVYGGAALDPHKAELVSYLIRMRPWREGTRPTGEPFAVVLDDCDGRAAELLLEDPTPITQRAPNSPVARAVVGADAIVLLADAASTPEQLTAAFREFHRFVRVVGRAKADARAVGGFPVFLVLTQCDRLARAGDTTAVWEARVTERVESASKAFADFLKEADAADDGPAPFLSFGSITLDVFAAAVRQPPLPGAGAPANHPYKVAELFRDCFAEARAHRTRAAASDVRLKWTVRAAAAALAVLLAGLATFALFPPRPTGPDLADKVRDYMAHEPPPAVRLADADVGRYKKALARFAGDPAYRDLDPALRAFVDGRVKEIDDYEAYRGLLTAAIEKPPGETRNLKPDLERVCRTLRDELKPPEQYDWKETAAAKLRDKWLADCAAIPQAVGKFVAKYRKYDEEGTALTRTRVFDAGWLADFEALVARADGPQFPPDEPIEGSYRVPQPKGEAVANRAVNEFDEVHHVRGYWEQTRDRVAHLRDLADALGLSTAPNRPKPVLDLPEPDGADSAKLAGERWAELLRLYPRRTDDWREWEVRNFPDPARSELKARLKRSFDAGVRHVQKLMKVTDTREGWAALAATLAEPAYREWGQLLHLLAHLQQPDAPNPVTELAKFLADLDAKTFDLDFRDGLTLTVPLDLTAGLDRVEPVGPLTITVAHGQEPPKAVKFALKKGETANMATTYTLTPESPDKIAYAAGDDLRAELPVKAGTQMLALKWETGPSNTFRFDRLTREPRLTKAPGGTEPATGVKLTPVNDKAIPPFPVLMPVK